LGNLETAVPRLLAMLCILAVFLPSFFMTGSARSLFVPLSLSVAFAMLSSYLLSSTLVPVVAAWLLRPHRGEATAEARALRGHAGLVRGLVKGRWLVVPVFLATSAAVVWVGGRSLPLEIFPRVDSGRFQLRLKAPTGTRIETTEVLTKRVLAAVDEEAGRSGVDVSVGYVGQIPSSYPINAIYQWSGGPEEAVVRVALREGAGVDVEGLKARLRARLAREMPEVRVAFEPADIVSDVMSFGSPTPVEVAVSGPNFAETRAHAEALRAELTKLPGLIDVQYAQALDYPTVEVQIDRVRAGMSDVTAAEVARSIVAATSSSRFVVPNYWPDPKSGIGYQVQVEIPFGAMDSVSDLESVPIQRAGGSPLLLRDVATVREGVMPGEYDRYNMKRMVSLTANLMGNDLGGAARQVDEAIARTGPGPKGVVIDVRGQVAPMREILSGLSVGLLASIVVILLVLTASFQSPRLAIVAISTTPAVLAGVVLALMATRTSVNIQSFMGSIMALGVSVANSILLVSFAERARRDGASAAEAAISAALERSRPILMTGMAMMAGMVPLAAGLGEGGEQTAPLGRAVIGGLAVSTIATLFVLPAVFAWVQGGAARGSASLDPDDPTSRNFDGHGLNGHGDAGVAALSLGREQAGAGALEGVDR
jgi:multidrug efflux pump subunit AcrB